MQEPLAHAFQTIQSNRTKTNMKILQLNQSNSNNEQIMQDTTYMTHS